MQYQGVKGRDIEVPNPGTFALGDQFIFCSIGEYFREVLFGDLAIKLRVLKVPHDCDDLGTRFCPLYSNREITFYDLISCLRTFPGRITSLHDLARIVSLESIQAS